MTSQSTMNGVVVAFLLGYALCFLSGTTMMSQHKCSVHVVPSEDPIQTEIYASSTDLGATVSKRRRTVMPLPSVWCPHQKNAKSPIQTTLERIKPGQLVLDVGAYDGANAIMMAKAGHNVISLEPTPSKTAKILKAFEDAKKNGLTGSIKFLPWAASNISGSAPFIVNAANPKRAGNLSDINSMGSQQDSFAVPWNLDKSAFVNVKTERIENIVPEGQDVLVMMVDAQGHDFRVIQGAHKLLQQHRIKVFLAEFAPTLMPGGVEEGIEMLEYISSMGYTCYGCGTAWNFGLEQGLPIAFDEYTKLIKEQPFLHRGANHGQWDDIVCVADSARRFG